MESDHLLTALFWTGLMMSVTKSCLDSEFRSGKLRERTVALSARGASQTRQDDNCLEGHAGTPWESCYKSSQKDSDN